MIEIVQFKADHLKEIKVQKAQMFLSEFVTYEQGLDLERSISFTALKDGKPVGAAGIVEQWGGRSTAWAFLSDVGPATFLAIHRAVKTYLDFCHIRRVEMTVACDFPEGHRWAKMLGFTLEAERMRSYDPNGADHSLYARVL